MKHERLPHSLDGAEDALGRARHMEERSRTGGIMKNPDAGLVCSDQSRFWKLSKKMMFVSMCCQVKQAVLAALDCGYRHIDCAAAYGNEQEVGEALAVRIGPGKVRDTG